MKKKNILLIILTIVFTIFLILASTIFVPYYNYNKSVIEKVFTEQESSVIAEQHIKESYPYNKLRGDNLVQIGKSVHDCDSCYSFKYRVEVISQKIPGEREFAEIEVLIEKGKVTETEFSKELIINDIKCSEEQRNIDFCITLYEPVCGYGFQGNKIKTYSNSCFACSDTDIEFYKMGVC